MAMVNHTQSVILTEVMEQCIHAIFNLLAGSENSSPNSKDPHPVHYYCTDFEAWWYVSNTDFPL